MGGSGNTQIKVNYHAAWKRPNLYSTISKCGENSPFVVLTLKPCYTDMFTQTNRLISVDHLSLVFSQLFLLILIYPL